MFTLKYTKLFDDVVTPEYKTERSSGMDVHAYIPDRTENYQSTFRIVYPGRIVIFNTGLCFSIPKGYEIQARSRSGLSFEHGIVVVNQPATIDSDYLGEVKIALVNVTENPKKINHQDRIAQLVICPVMQASLVQVETELFKSFTSGRGTRGFGSTGN